MSVESTPLRGPALSLTRRRWLSRLDVDWPAGGLQVGLPGGRGKFSLGREPDAWLELRNWRALRRVALHGDVGFAEGYITGDWETPDLAQLLRRLAENYDRLDKPRAASAPRRIASQLRHALRRNSRRGARRNILAHYDLGNDFYSEWLDGGLSYSAGRFDAGHDLDGAQASKIAHMARLAGVAAGSRVLEIGCGWGGFAEHAASAGADVTAITLSPSQKAYAQARLERAGLGHRARVELRDYRDVEGVYDAIVSIEMFEAVGEAYWPAYFAKIRDSLARGGRAALQIITIRDDLFDAYRAQPDFIQLHVFPGGMLPSPTRLREEIARAGLRLESWDDFGPDYARTLAFWRERFEAAWPAIAKLGFDGRFRRLWRYYLAYCEAGFATGRTNVCQVALSRP